MLTLRICQYVPNLNCVSNLSFGTPVCAFEYMSTFKMELTPEVSECQSHAKNKIDGGRALFSYTDMNFTTYRQ